MPVLQRYSVRLERPGQQKGGTWRNGGEARRGRAGQHPLQGGAHGRHGGECRERCALRQACLRHGCGSGGGSHRHLRRRSAEASGSMLASSAGDRGDCWPPGRRPTQHSRAALQTWMPNRWPFAAASRWHDDHRRRLHHPGLGGTGEGRLRTADGGCRAGPMEEPGSSGRHEAAAARPALSCRTSAFSARFSATMAAS